MLPLNVIHNQFRDLIGAKADRQALPRSWTLEGVKRVAFSNGLHLRGLCVAVGISSTHIVYPGQLLESSLVSLVHFFPTVK